MLIPTIKYEKRNPTIRKFRDEMYHKTECLPIGQRLPVKSTDNEKSVGIIKTLLDGFDIGTITIVKLNRKQRRAAAKVKYEFESIDGGHRKRSLWEYLQDGFKVDGKFFSELTDEKKASFLDTELSFTIYDELDTVTKGQIFRTLNKTTDVNFIEMLNSYGDEVVANFIRETVRIVKQINNKPHVLFDYHNSTKTGESIYHYLSFDNDRLKQDHAFARIAYRYICHPKTLLDGSHDKELEVMYQDKGILEISQSTKSKVKKHLDFLLAMSEHRKIKYKGGLTQHDFKAMSYLYFYMLDTYKSFEIIDYEDFFEAYAIANTTLMNKDGKYADIVHETSGYSVQVMYKKYIAAPWDGKKISTAIAYLIGEMKNNENFIKTKDVDRAFTVLEKEAKLAGQGFVCAVDGKKLNWKDAHAAHIIAHTNGGLTVYSNLAMVRACYNTEMGTMSLNDYMEQLVA